MHNQLPLSLPRAHRRPGSGDRRAPGPPRGAAEVRLILASQDVAGRAHAVGQDRLPTAEAMRRELEWFPHLFNRRPANGSHRPERLNAVPEPDTALEAVLVCDPRCRPLRSQEGPVPWPREGFYVGIKGSQTGLSMLPWPKSGLTHPANAGISRVRSDLHRFRPPRFTNYLLILPDTSCLHTASYIGRTRNYGKRTRNYGRAYPELRKCVPGATGKTFRIHMAVWKF